MSAWFLVYAIGTIVLFLAMAGVRIMLYRCVRPRSEEEAYGDMLQDPRFFPSEQGTSEGYEARPIPSLRSRIYKADDESPPKTDETAQTPCEDKSSHCKQCTDSQGNAMCPICINPFESGESVIELACTHMFHADCLLPWLKEDARRSCPTCRQPCRQEASADAGTILARQETSIDCSSVIRASAPNNSHDTSEGAVIIEMDTAAPDAVSEHSVEESTQNDTVV